VSCIILFTVIALAPLPFGSTEPAVISVWCVALGVALILAKPRKLVAGQYLLFGVLCVVIVAYAIVLHEQLSAQPWFSFIAPDAAWRAAEEVLGKSLPAAGAVARDQPFFAVGAPMAALLSVTCSFVVCAEAHRARQLLKVVGWSGVGYALFGIVSNVMLPGKVLWRDKETHFANLTSTFLNRNTAAIYLGSCAVVLLVMLCDRVRQNSDTDSESEWRGRLRAWDFLHDNLLYFCMLVVCVAAMLMTSSRAGVLLSLMMLIGAFALYFRRELSRRSTVFLSSIAGGAAVALVLVQMLGVGARFDEQGLAAGGRWETYRATWRMITEHPWIGTGLGTFPWSYPQYRSDTVSIWGTWDRAHNTLLELAAELGLPFAGIVVLAWLVVLAFLAHGAWVRRSGRIYPVAGLSVALLALLHSSIDFSLQIPGYSIVAFAVIGAGLAQSFRNVRPRKSM
jgi:O-antigen ligase